MVALHSKENAESAETEARLWMIGSEDLLEDRQGAREERFRYLWTSQAVTEIAFVVLPLVGLLAVARQSGRFVRRPHSRELWALMRAQRAYWRFASVLVGLFFALLVAAFVVGLYLNAAPAP